MRNGVTHMETVITFTVKGKQKKMIYNGAYHEAISTIRMIYPYYCCVGGHANERKDLVKGNYTIIDVATGLADHTFSS